MLSSRKVLGMSPIRSALGVEVLAVVPGEGEAGEPVLDDAVGAAVPEGGAVGGDRQDPEGALGGLRGDEVAGEEGVRQHDAFGHAAGERPHLVLTRRCEDHQAVLGVCQVDLGEGLVELAGDVEAPLPGDRGIGFQLLLGLGHDIAQPDRVLGVVGLPAMCRSQHGHRWIGAWAPELGEGRGTECVLHIKHDRTDLTTGHQGREGLPGGDRQAEQTGHFAASVA